MKKLSIALITVVMLFSFAIKSEAFSNTEQSLTKEQVLIMDNFVSEKMKDIMTIKNQIKDKKHEIEVVKRTKITEKFQQEKIAKLNKDIDKLNKNLKKAEKKYQNDYIKKYNSILTKEQAKTMKLKNKIILKDRPCTLPAYYDNIKKERG
jgi:hypothetical protein